MLTRRAGVRQAQLGVVDCRDLTGDSGDTQTIGSICGDFEIQNGILTITVDGRRRRFDGRNLESPHRQHVGQLLNTGVDSYEVTKPRNENSQ